MQRLDGAERRRLLTIARRAIEAALCDEVPSDADDAPLPAALLAPRAAFVTLRRGGELRGCIGRLRLDGPLWATVRDCALAAALGDPRFPPLARAELGRVEIEVTVLEPAFALADPADFEAGRHGIVVERDLRRAVLLPQVATEMGWDARQMLDAVCLKAGLRADAWRDPATSLSVFEATVFAEGDLAGDPAGDLAGDLAAIGVSARGSLARR